MDGYKFIGNILIGSGILFWLIVIVIFAIILVTYISSIVFVGMIFFALCIIFVAYALGYIYSV